MKTKIILFITLCILCAFRSYSQEFEEVQIATPSDISDYSRFGCTISLSGNYAIVGDVFASGEYSDYITGAAYIYKRDNNGNWNEIQKLFISDGPNADYFGSSVSISGNRAIVGAYGEDEDASGENSLPFAGSAYIFECDVNGSWKEVQKLVPSDRNDHDLFGMSSLDIFKDYAIVGNKYKDVEITGESPLMDAGSAYVFKRDATGNWSEVQRLIASDHSAFNYFGQSVSISGNYAIVGSSQINNTGAVYIFKKDATANWTEVQKIIASDHNSYDTFGRSVSISGNYIVVSAQYEDEDASGEHTMENSGSAYIFKRNSNDVWNEVQKIVASDRSSYDQFGSSVDISEDYIIVGADNDDEDTDGENFLPDAGSAYIFKRESNGSWLEVQKITAANREQESFFGNSVSIDNNYAIVGIDQDDDNYPGKAYILESCFSSNPADPDNIIENGGFESCILSPWSVIGNPSARVGCDALINNGKCKVSVFDPNSNPQHWHAQLNQELSASQLHRLEKGASYTLTFEASAKENKGCRISFERNEDPWTPLLDKTITISKEPKSFSFDFIAHTVFSKMKLSFQVGIDDSQVIFDNVRLVKKVPTAIKNQENNNPIRIYPNPVTDVLYIKAQEGTFVRLYDQTGRLLKDKILEDDELSIDVSNLPSGLYILAVSNGIHSSVQKVIVQ